MPAAETQTADMKLTVPEAANILGKPRQTILHHINKGHVQASRSPVGRDIYQINPSDLANLAQTLERGLYQSIGVLLFVKALRDTGVMKEETYREFEKLGVKALRAAYSIETLKPVMDKLLHDNATLKQMLEQSEFSE